MCKELFMSFNRSRKKGYLWCWWMIHDRLICLKICCLVLCSLPYSQQPPSHFPRWFLSSPATFHCVTFFARPIFSNRYFRWFIPVPIFWLKDTYIPKGTWQSFLTHNGPTSSHTRGRAFCCTRHIIETKSKRYFSFYLVTTFEFWILENFLES